jgi:glutamyl-Q tRNA(Asp) synthetase
MTPEPAKYRGRFAPSPTGPLHLGSLLAAVASYLDARANEGDWLVRIEDIDRPRTMPGAADAILHTLERHGLEWSGAPVRQSERTDLYRAALERLGRAGRTFHCTCSRSALADEPVYPGTCRARGEPTTAGSAIRIRVDDVAIAFDDEVQGRFTQALAHDVGDFVVLRRDGLFAYQLAVVVDDAEQRVDHVVRGADLLDNTPRQLFLGDALGLARPRHAHVPVLLGADGQKLSKQTFAASIDRRDPVDNLMTILDLLGQRPPSALRHESIDRALAWAVANWSLQRVPKERALTGFACVC